MLGLHEASAIHNVQTCAQSSHILLGSYAETVTATEYSFLENEGSINRCCWPWSMLSNCLIFLGTQGTGFGKGGTSAYFQFPKVRPLIIGYTCSP